MMAKKRAVETPALEDVETGDKTRVEIWTDRFVIVGDAHVPHSIRGTKSRLSDLLNQSGKPFLPLTDVTLQSPNKKRLWRGEFLVLNKASIVLVKVVKE
jgi:hypothetical protein